MNILNIIKDKLLSLFHNLSETGLYVLLGVSFALALTLFIL